VNQCCARDTTDASRRLHIYEPLAFRNPAEREGWNERRRKRLKPPTTVGSAKYAAAHTARYRMSEQTGFGAPGSAACTSDRRDSHSHTLCSFCGTGSHLRVRSADSRFSGINDKSDDSSRRSRAYRGGASTSPE